MPEFNPNQFDINRVTPEFDFTGQKREGEDFLAGLREQIGSFESLPEASKRLGQEFGVPGLREQALRFGELGEDLTSQILGTPDVIQGTTRESLVNESQRQRLVQKTQEPLLESLRGVTSAGEKVGARLASAQDVVAQRLGLLQADQNRQLLTFERGFDLLQTRQARQFTGYTFENQQELTRLINNQNAGVTLSEGERNRLNQLALQEMSYKQALDSIKEQGAQNRETSKFETFELDTGNSLVDELRGLYGF